MALSSLVVDSKAMDEKGEGFLHEGSKLKQDTCGLYNSSYGGGACRQYRSFGGGVVKTELSLNLKKLHDSRWRNPQKKCHRRRGISHSSWYEIGRKYYKGYYVNGRGHKTKGPFEIFWYKNGKKRIEVWGFDGKFHNLEGPAYTRWDEDGRKESEEYWINGVRVTKGEWEECK